MSIRQPSIGGSLERGSLRGDLVPRARIANDEIVQTTVQYCLDNGVQVPATREEIVAYAFANGVVKTAAERQAEAEAAMASMEA